MGITIEVSGRLAYFDNFELSGRKSYPMITFSAARGILDNIYWNPGMHWLIDEITVCNPIKYTIKILDGMPKDVLENVRYIIRAHFSLTASATKGDTPERYISMTTRRIERGEFKYPVYLGRAEFPARVRLVDEFYLETPRCFWGTVNLGRMLKDVAYDSNGDIYPIFFNCTLVNGKVRYSDRERSAPIQPSPEENIPPQGDEHSTEYITQEDVIDLYHKIGSLKSTAGILEIAPSTVKKVLITNGIYPTVQSKEIHGLTETGMHVSEIAKRLGISIKAVQSNMPYTKCPYVLGPKTNNALRIRRCRRRKEMAEEISE